jgi:5-methylcytosine-specific restriction endonuclease McrA
MSFKRTDSVEARRMARRAYWRQGGLCHWCRGPMTLDKDNPRSMTADHLKPVWDGGRTRPGNIVAACYQCNQERGKITNQLGKKWRLTVGDDTPASPFEVLAGRIKG